MPPIDGPTTGNDVGDAEVSVISRCCDVTMSRIRNFGIA